MTIRAASGTRPIESPRHVGSRDAPGVLKLPHASSPDTKGCINTSPSDSRSAKVGSPWRKCRIQTEVSASTIRQAAAAECSPFRGACRQARPNACRLHAQSTPPGPPALMRQARVDDQCSSHMH